MPNTKPNPFIRPEEFWEQIELRVNQTIVHLGCGAGFYLIPAAKKVGRKGQVIGIDVLKDMLEEAEDRAVRANVADTIETIRSNLENGPVGKIKNNIADWTLVANILYQSDPEKILTEAKRITKQSGTIIVVEWNVSYTPLGPPPDDRIAKSQVLDISKKMKLELLKEFVPSPYHYGLLFTAKI
jgi:ubiquinone/menaquinone biosynthesis C-methylase UbiE